MDHNDMKTAADEELEANVSYIEKRLQEIGDLVDEVEALMDASAFPTEMAKLLANIRGCVSDIECTLDDVLF